MESITLGQIGVVVTFLVGLISGISYLRAHLKKWVAESVKDEIKPLEDGLKEVKTRVDAVDMENCKNFLVQQLAEAERGIEWDEIERERFWEQYEHYTEHGGNSYIKQKVERLQKNNKI